MVGFSNQITFLPINFDCISPIFGAIHEVVFGHEQRNADNRSFVEDCEEILVILFVVWPFVS